MRKRFALFCVLAASLAFAIQEGSLANAATVLAATGPCSMKLDGAIRQGDNVQLKEMLEKASSNSKMVLCLNSPGGSYNEALALIDVILGANHIIATMVPKGSHCYSACSLVFLAGHRDESKDQPDRRLDASSILGFHGPYIKPGEKDYDPILVARAYREGVKAIGRLMGMARGQLFPDSLLSIGLEKGPEEFFYIDTVDKAGKWNVAVVGTTPLRIANRKSIFRACANSVSWQGGPAPFDDTKPIAIQFKNKKHRTILRDFGDEAAWICVVDVYDAGDKGHFMDLHWVADSRSPSKDEVLPDPDDLERKVLAADTTMVAPGTPVWYNMEKNTKLRQLSAK